jgi:heat shock protein HslJ
MVLLVVPVSVPAQDSRTFSGSLVYRERIALPPDAEMLLELRDNAGTVVASARQRSEGAQVPLSFAIQAPTTAALSLRAALRIGEGIRFLGEPVAIASGGEAVDLGEVMLRGYRPMGFSSRLSCGELTAELGFLGQGARLRVGAQYFDLVPERTASGAKYVSPDNPGTWIWTKGRVATLSLDGIRFPECREVLPDDSYTARGNEPGWRLEISGGLMRYSGDYGETSIDAPLPAAEIEAHGRRYAPEGADMVLALSQGLCHDDMSGMPYPDVARLETGGRVLSGCGGDPMDLLSAHPWRVQDIDGQAVIDDANITLLVSPGGRLSGSAGCNRYFGKLTLTGEGLSLGPVGATMMACPEVLMTQERRFFDALSRVTRFDIGEGGALRLFALGDRVITARR